MKKIRMALVLLTLLTGCADTYDPKYGDEILGSYSGEVSKTAFDKTDYSLGAPNGFKKEMTLQVKEDNSGYYAIDDNRRFEIFWEEKHYRVDKTEIVDKMEVHTTMTFFNWAGNKEVLWSENGKATDR